MILAAIVGAAWDGAVFALAAMAAITLQMGTVPIVALGDDIGLGEVPVDDALVDILFG